MFYFEQIKRLIKLREAPSCLRVTVIGGNYM